MIQHGQGTSKLSSINLNLVTYQYLQINHLCIWKQNVASFSWIFFLLNTRGILARFPNKSSKLSGPFISSLRKSTDGITSILPLPIEISPFGWFPYLLKPLKLKHILIIYKPFSYFYSFRNLPQSQKLLKRSSKLSPPMQQWPQNQLELNDPLLQGHSIWNETNFITFPSPSQIFLKLFLSTPINNEYDAPEHFSS